MHVAGVVLAALLICMCHAATKKTASTAKADKGTAKADKTVKQAKPPTLPKSSIKPVDVMVRAFGH